MTDDPQEAPPPSAPQPVNGQPTVAARGNAGPVVNAQVQVIIDPRQRGSLSAGFHARAWQGYDTYKTDVAAYYRDIARCNPDFIAMNAERFDRTANSSTSFLQDPSGRFVAQYTMANGNYNLARVYDMTDPRPNGDAFQLDRMRSQLADGLQRSRSMDPLLSAQIDARHVFEEFGMNNPGVIAGANHVYPHSGRNGTGDAYLIQNINGREYGGKYAFENGYFRMQQLFDLQRPAEARAFQQQEEASALREFGPQRGPYGGRGMPIPYPGRGGTDVGVVIGNGRGGSEVGVHVGNRREGTDVGVVIGTDRRGDVHGGGHVDMRLPGGGRFDIGIFKR